MITITFTMSKFSLSLLSLSLLLFTCLANRSELDRFNQCQLDNINALEPDHRVECEAGLIETWNSNHRELQCAGVSLVRRTIDPNGLHLPSYSPSPQLIFIIQGKGVLGLSAPGCPETFEEPRSSSQSRQRSRHQQEQQQPDSHQKIRRFNKGDIIAIPAGIPYWTYNNGDEPLVAISLLDTSNNENQLDSTPRVFYLGGNPETEFPETQEGQQQQQGRHHQRPRFPGGRRSGHHQQEEQSEEQNEGNSVLSGFSAEFLAQALNMNEDTAQRLQSPRDQRSQIVRVDDDFQIISPEWEDQDEYEEDEDEDERRSQRKEEDFRRQRQDRRQRREEDEDEDEDERRPRHDRRREQREEREPRHGRREEDEDEEDERRSRETSQKWRKHREEQKRGSHGRREEEVEYEEEQRREKRREHGRENGLEETICSAKIRENIARPSRADLYNPRAGRISTANSLTLPILRNLRLSAEYVLLYRNGIYAPHWTNNANGLMYVLRGQGRVQIVNCEGNTVFDDNVRKGQLLVVPQNFVVAEQAGEEEGLEYVVLKTNDRASVSHVKQVFRDTPAEVLANAFGLRQNEITKIKFSGNRGPLVQPQSHSQ